MYIVLELHISPVNIDDSGVDVESDLGGLRLLHYHYLKLSGASPLPLILTRENRSLSFS